MSSIESATQQPGHPSDPSDPLIVDRPAPQENGSEAGPTQSCSNGPASFEPPRQTTSSRPTVVQGRHATYSLQAESGPPPRRDLPLRRAQRDARSNEHSSADRPSCPPKAVTASADTTNGHGRRPWKRRPGEGWLGSIKKNRGSSGRDETSRPQVHTALMLSSGAYGRLMTGVVVAIARDLGLVLCEHHAERTYPPDPAPDTSSPHPDAGSKENSPRIPEAPGADDREELAQPVLNPTTVDGGRRAIRRMIRRRVPAALRRVPAADADRPGRPNRQDVENRIFATFHRFLLALGRDRFNEDGTVYLSRFERWRLAHARALWYPTPTEAELRRRSRRVATLLESPSMARLNILSESFTMPPSVHRLLRRWFTVKRRQYLTTANTESGDSVQEDEEAQRAKYDGDPSCRTVENYFRWVDRTTQEMIFAIRDGQSSIELESPLQHVAFDTPLADENSEFVVNDPSHAKRDEEAESTSNAARPSQRQSMDMSAATQPLPFHFFRSYCFELEESDDCADSPLDGSPNTEPPSNQTLLPWMFISVKGMPAVRAPPVAGGDDAVIDEDNSGPNDRAGAAVAPGTGNDQVQQQQHGVQDALRCLLHWGTPNRFARRSPKPPPPTYGYFVQVIGGFYPKEYTVLRSPNLVGESELTDDERLELAEINGDHHKPPATARQIEASDLIVVPGCELSALGEQGEVLENCIESCLICFDDYGDEPERLCRVLGCKHAYHKDCIDFWLENNQNCCPTCRLAAIKKGKSAATPRASRPWQTVEVMSTTEAPSMDPAIEVEAPSTSST